MGSSLKGAMVSRVMYRARCTAHSSFCSSRIAPTRRVMAASLGKMPTTSVRRLISPLRRSSGLVLWIFGRWSLGKLMKARTSASASSIQDGELCHLGSELIGYLAPLGAGHFGILLGEGGGDERGDDTPAVLAGMGQDIAHEVH